MRQVQIRELLKFYSNKYDNEASIIDHLDNPDYTHLNYALRMLKYADREAYNAIQIQYLEEADGKRPDPTLIMRGLNYLDWALQNVELAARGVFVSPRDRQEVYFAVYDSRKPEIGHLPAFREALAVTMYSERRGRELLARRRKHTNRYNGEIG